MVGWEATEISATSLTMVSNLETKVACGTGHEQSDRSTWFLISPYVGLRLPFLHPDCSLAWSYSLIGLCRAPHCRHRRRRRRLRTALRCMPAREHASSVVNTGRPAEKGVLASQSRPASGNNCHRPVKPSFQFEIGYGQCKYTWSCIPKKTQLKQTTNLAHGS